ncbi:MAG: type II toxin-antitoxin system VapC family toxin [Candidatus Omnitrophica bacterium]|nr:type II toxin-antitoxin system VapC family toxin [Candidatus Omnitrophota bacterium]
MAAGVKINIMLILDTCALLWLVADQKKLSAKAKKTIEHHAGALFVSSISSFEIAIKCRNHKMALPLPVMQWFTEAMDFHGLREIPVASDIAVCSAELPLLHNDPCDRIIIATAQLNDMAILTCDELIYQYKVSVVW